MKATILLVTSFLLLACGSRNKNLTKMSEQTRSENNVSLTENSLSKNSESTVTDIRKFILSNGLKIKSTGQNYELKYGDMTFSGSADLEFTENKKETLIHHVYQLHTTYITDTKYQTKTFYKKEKRSKSLNIERSGISFGSIFWIVSASLIIGAIISQLFRLYLKRKS